MNTHTCTYIHIKCVFLTCIPTYVCVCVYAFVLLSTSEKSASGFLQPKTDILHLFMYTYGNVMILFLLIF